MKFRLTRARVPLLAVVATLAITACEESLESGLACPTLCPNQQVLLQEDTIAAVSLDTTLGDYPSIGGESRFFLASFGDTLQTRGVVRFDSLPQTFRRANSADDSTITAVDTGAYVRFTVDTIDTLSTDSTTIEIYDVDLDGAEESDPRAVSGAFTPARFLGSRTFSALELKDSATVPIDPDRLLAMIQRESPGNRLRLGVKVADRGSRKVTLGTANGGAPAILIFRPSLDDEVPTLSVLPRSRTPDIIELSDDLADYLVVPVAPPPPGPDVIRVGGLPATRGYLRFDVPARIIDSSNVVRATLLMTQSPARFSSEADSSTLVHHLRVVSSSTITDLYRRAIFTQRTRLRDTLMTAPSDSGLRTFEMIELVRAWVGTDIDETPRALVLKAINETSDGRIVEFFSLEAPPGVRPRLVVTYSPRRPERLP